ncbi:RNA polymerase factor sigma-54 [Paracidovorax cattleyae]|uniref:RNA polymerase sigma-54 factor n=1 Tax=Paracidovorax cattleyae TaxID=80868 RepID=A0A1H0NTG7_9BURK|nr:RNA polymerase factor sigma-54 [Paracidovorax cattleyae]AVS75105.1 RNA polymerase sigma-54 factor [Paracidovorax cattleyae]SDO95700.1 RNA polymerase, sigma 54 subunit, RpoN/SigL [Paracidovorax cattleyae]
MPTLALRARQTQSPHLSPRLQKAVQLLQMPTAEFIQSVMAAVDENPFLEEDEPAAPAAPGPEDGPAWTAAPGSRSAQGGSGDGLSMLEREPATATLHEHLHAQLRLLRLPDRAFLLASLVVEELSDDGYLAPPLESLCGDYGVDPEATPEELDAALRTVQSLEPAGVGARNLQECLSLQLPAVVCPLQRALCDAVLARAAEGSGPQAMRQLATRLDVPAHAVREALERLRHLDPHPGWRHGHQPVQYIVPDVIAHKARGQWTVSLNEAVMPRVRVNRQYQQLLQTPASAADGAPSVADDAGTRTAHRDLAEQLAEARWTVRHVQQRFSTVLDVARAILRRQPHFLEYGPIGMRPLALKDIAEDVGVHVSTVSRVTNNKYLQTPFGLFELKYFFSRAMATPTGRDSSPTAIRGLVQEILAADDGQRPLSDVDIARQLERQGIRIARRTVTKYRQQLRIPPAEQRAAALP